MLLPFWDTTLRGLVLETVPYVELCKVHHNIQGLPMSLTCCQPSLVNQIGNKAKWTNSTLLKVLSEFLPIMQLQAVSSLIWLFPRQHLFPLSVSQSHSHIHTCYLQTCFHAINLKRELCLISPCCGLSFIHCRF